MYIPKPSRITKGQKWTTFTPPATAQCRRYRGRVLLLRLQDYYLANPEFIRLVNSANLHQGKHLKGSEKLKTASRKYIAMIQRLLDRGAAE
ncbi:MAG: hypothetical protein AAFO75_07035, partial [Pseudomonadota bacterium]